MIVFNWLLLALAGVALAIGFVAFLDEIRDRQKCDLCGHSMRSHSYAYPVTYGLCLELGCDCNRKEDLR